MGGVHFYQFLFLCEILQITFTNGVSLPFSSFSSSVVPIRPTNSSMTTINSLPKVSANITSLNSKFGENFNSNNNALNSQSETLNPGSKLVADQLNLPLPTLGASPMKGFTSYSQGPSILNSDLKLPLEYPQSDVSNIKLDHQRTVPTRSINSQILPECSSKITSPTSLSLPSLDTVGINPLPNLLGYDKSTTCFPNFPNIPTGALSSVTLPSPCELYAPTFSTYQSNNLPAILPNCPYNSLIESEMRCFDTTVTGVKNSHILPTRALTSVNLAKGSNTCPTFESVEKVHIQPANNISPLASSTYITSPGIEASLLNNLSTTLPISPRSGFVNAPFLPANTISPPLISSNNFKSPFIETADPCVLPNLLTNALNNNLDSFPSEIVYRNVNTEPPSLGPIGANTLNILSAPSSVKSCPVADIRPAQLCDISPGASKLQVKSFDLNLLSVPILDANFSKPIQRVVSPTKNIMSSCQKTETLLPGISTLQSFVDESPSFTNVLSQTPLPNVPSQCYSPKVGTNLFNLNLSPINLPSITSLTFPQQLPIMNMPSTSFNVLENRLLECGNSFQSSPTQQLSTINIPSAQLNNVKNRLSECTNPSPSISGQCSANSKITSPSKVNPTVVNVNQTISEILPLEIPLTSSYNKVSSNPLPCPNVVPSVYNGCPLLSPSATISDNLPSSLPLSQSTIHARNEIARQMLFNTSAPTVTGFQSSPYLISDIPSLSAVNLPYLNPKSNTFSVPANFNPSTVLIAYVAPCSNEEPLIKVLDLSFNDLLKNTQKSLSNVIPILEVPKVSSFQNTKSNVPPLCGPYNVPMLPQSNDPQVISNNYSYNNLNQNPCATVTSIPNFSVLPTSTLAPVSLPNGIMSPCESAPFINFNYLNLLPTDSNTSPAVKIAENALILPTNNICPIVPSSDYTKAPCIDIPTSKSIPTPLVTSQNNIFVDAPIFAPLVNTVLPTSLLLPTESGSNCKVPASQVKPSQTPLLNSESNFNLPLVYLDESSLQVPQPTVPFVDKIVLNANNNNAYSSSVFNSIQSPSPTVNYLPKRPSLPIVEYLPHVAQSASPISLSSLETSTKSTNVLSCFQPNVYNLFPSTPPIPHNIQSQPRFDKSIVPHSIEAPGLEFYSRPPPITPNVISCPPSFNNLEKIKINPPVSSIPEIVNQVPIVLEPRMCYLDSSYYAPTVPIHSDPSISLNNIPKNSYSTSSFFPNTYPSTSVPTTYLPTSTFSVPTVNYLSSTSNPSNFNSLASQLTNTFLTSALSNLTSLYSKPKMPLVQQIPIVLLPPEKPKSSKKKSKRKSRKISSKSFAPNYLLASESDNSFVYTEVPKEFLSASDYYEDCPVSNSVLENSLDSLTNDLKCDLKSDASVVNTSLKLINATGQSNVPIKTTLNNDDNLVSQNCNETFGRGSKSNFTCVVTDFDRNSTIPHSDTINSELSAEFCNTSSQFNQSTVEIDALVEHSAHNITSPEEIAHNIVLKELMNSDSKCNWKLLEKIIKVFTSEDT